MVPGFDAQPQTTETPGWVAKTITLTSKAFKDTNKPTYKIVSGPAHGGVGTVNSEGKVTYTLTAGFTGTDTFTFSAADASSKFPKARAGRHGLGPSRLLDPAGRLDRRRPRACRRSSVQLGQSRQRLADGHLGGERRHDHERRLLHGT